MYLSVYGFLREGENAMYLPVWQKPWRSGGVLEGNNEFTDKAS